MKLQTKTAIQQAFSLVELLIVIAIIGVLVALLLPAIQKARGAFNRLACSQKLRQIGIALHAYHGVYEAFPPALMEYQNNERYPFLSWQGRLLPFIDQQPLWEKTRKAYEQNNFPPYQDPPYVGKSTVLKLLSCPSEVRSLLQDYGGTKYAYTSYFGVSGTNLFTNDGIFFPEGSVSFQDIIDGTSNTAMVGERPVANSLEWGHWLNDGGQGDPRGFLPGSDIIGPNPQGLGKSGISTGSADYVLGAREINTQANNFPTDSDCSQGPYPYGPGRVENSCDQFHFWSLHTKGANFLFADGSVHFLDYSMGDTLVQLATRNGGEVVDAKGF